MRFLPHAHRISLLSPAPVSHIFHSCRPSMPQTQKAALVPTPIKQSHKAMVVSYRPQTLHDTIHTVLPGEVLPAIPSYSEFIAVRLFVFQLTASRRGWRNPWIPLMYLINHFNSQPHEEADPTGQATDAASFTFQLTASRRGWQLQCLNFQQLWYFNSQPHEEADEVQENAIKINGISTHSLTKRLTAIAGLCGNIQQDFNSQPHEEADIISDVLLSFLTYFNSQPHEEADWDW